MKFNTKIMGVLNFTPDSFSDGNKFFTVDKALKQVEHLIDGGADIIDVGAESGKPRYIYESDDTLITQEEEWKRLESILPQIIEIAHSRNIQVSVDTRNAKTAEKALALKADIINDCTALTDPNMIPVLKNSNAKIIVVHNLGVPLIKGHFIPKGKNPTTEIISCLKNYTEKLIDGGISRDRIIVDPGIGIGKNGMQSLYIMKNLAQLKALKYPICLGHSRKSCFMPFKLHDPTRDNATLITSVILFLKGIEFFRVHNAHIHNEAFSIIKKIMQINLKDVYNSL